MKKIMIFILPISLIIVATIIIIISLNPLRKSEEKIREDMLILTPIGSSIEEVIKAIESNETWRKKYAVYERGYALMSIGEPITGYCPTVFYSKEAVNLVKVVGIKSIEVYAGSYRNVFRRDILVYFGFDENSKLIDIAIRKDVDTL